MSMGVYIKGMEMPTRCAECRLSTVHSFNERPLCDVLVEYMSYGEWETKRLDNCPLVPVPPHGRCVDADKLMQEMRLFIKENMLSRDDARELLETIEDSPTIIPAEEGE